MPIPRTWSEELVCEWLCLKGYSTEVGIPLSKGLMGGRDEADIVGFKIGEIGSKKSVLQINHVEIGQLGGFDYNIKMLKKKFSEKLTILIKKNLIKIN